MSNATLYSHHVKCRMVTETENGTPKLVFIYTAIVYAERAFSTKPKREVWRKEFRDNNSEAERAVRSKVKEFYGSK